MLVNSALCGCYQSPTHRHWGETGVYSRAGF